MGTRASIRGFGIQAQIRVDWAAEQMRTAPGEPTTPGFASLGIDMSYALIGEVSLA